MRRTPDTTERLNGRNVHKDLSCRVSCGAESGRQCSHRGVHSESTSFARQFCQSQRSSWSSLVVFAWLLLQKNWKFGVGDDPLLTTTWRLCAEFNNIFGKKVLRFPERGKQKRAGQGTLHPKSHIFTVPMNKLLQFTQNSRRLQKLHLKDTWLPNTKQFLRNLTASLLWFWSLSGCLCWRVVFRVFSPRLRLGVFSPSEPSGPPWRRRRNSPQCVALTSAPRVGSRGQE